MNEKPTILDHAFNWLATTPGQILIAGLIGGVIRWLTPGAGDWRARLLSLISGAATAWYFAPPASSLVAGWMSRPADDVQVVAAIAFFLGVGGISIVALLVDISKRLNSSAVSKRLVETIVFAFTGKGPTP